MNGRNNNNNDNNNTTRRCEVEIIVEIHSVVVSTERRLRFLFGDDEDVARPPSSTLVLSISVSAAFFLTGVKSGIISKPGLRA